MRDTNSDIYQHIDTLRDYATRCASVVEAGVRYCESSWALLKGLTESTIPGQKSLVSLDLTKSPQVREVEAIAPKLGVRYSFVEGNDLHYPLGEMVDMVFIDTWHVYGQLKRELEKFAPYTRKYIVLHDTTVDEHTGESVRLGLDIRKQMAQTGYSFIEIYAGLWPAVEEFLWNNRQWVIERRYTHCNGLTILRRVG